jgi:hypothetical protein
MRKLVSLTRAFTFGMAVLSIPTLALAQATLVELGVVGEVTEAGVVIPVKIACMDDSDAADISVRLTQPQPSPENRDRMASGEGDVQVECGITPQTVPVLVGPDPGSVPFDLGQIPIAGTVELDACDSSFNNCNFLDNATESEIVD